MNSNALIALSLLLTLSGCANTTPIAVPTKEWTVPPPAKDLVETEQQALKEVTTATIAWEQWLSTLPSQPATPAAH